MAIDLADRRRPAGRRRRATDRLLALEGRDGRAPSLSAALAVDPRLLAHRPALPAALTDPGAIGRLGGRRRGWGSPWASVMAEGGGVAALARAEDEQRIDPRDLEVGHAHALDDLWLDPNVALRGG